MLRRTVPIELIQNPALGAREVEIRMMTGGLKADGYDLMPEGCVLDDYVRNPIQLWQHNPDFPVGTNDNIRIDGGGIAARCRFADEGISAKADEVCGLVKTGIVRACSVGFEVVEREPIDPKDPRRGWRALRWVLFECSFVSVPMVAGAGVTARAQREGSEMAEWKCGAARNLAIQDGDPAWDGSAAEAAIFEWAGGDDFDPVKARKGFLAYDASAPELRGSYKLPFVHVEDGELVVPKSALRAASGAHGVEAADIGDAKDEAQNVLDHYKEKAGIGEEGRSRRRRRHSVQRSRETKVKIRGMYGIAQLAWVIDSLCDCKWSADYEKSLEGDESKVPAMLAANIQSLGETLIAMTAEEVTELVEQHGLDDDDLVLLSDRERAEVEAAKTPALRTFLAGKFRARAVLTSARAGKALSAANAEKIGEAEAHHDRALEHHADAVEAHKNLGEHHDAVRAACSGMRSAHDGMKDELDKERPDPEVLRSHHRKMGRSLDTADGEMAGAQDEQEAMGDAHRGIARSVRAAKRCLRDVDGYDDGDDDDDQRGEGAAGGNSTVQKSDGVTQDEGSRSADFRRRQAEKLGLQAA